MNSLTWFVNNEVCELMIPLTFWVLLVIFSVLKLLLYKMNVEVTFPHPPQNDGSSPTVITIAKYIF